MEPNITYYPNSNIIFSEEWFYEQGVKKVITYDRDGLIAMEQWYKDKECHLLDGPAHQGWYKNGQKRFEYWHKEGKIHRSDGPAVRWWCDNGEISRQLWYVDGEMYGLDGSQCATIFWK